MIKFALMVALALVAWLAWNRWRRQAGLGFIERQALPTSLRAQLREQQPGWSEAQLDDVELGLRQFFRICARAPGKFMAMPSKAVDLAWHAFIVDTRAYANYCERAFGRMLHHTPAQALADGEAATRLRFGLGRSWTGACRDEGLDPRKTTQLPLLFALDARLGIEGGYRYAPDCHRLANDRGDTHCGTHLASCGGGGSGDGCGGMVETAAEAAEGAVTEPPSISLRTHEALLAPRLALPAA